MGGFLWCVNKAAMQKTNSISPALYLYLPRRFLLLLWSWNRGWNLLRLPHWMPWNMSVGKSLASDESCCLMQSSNLSSPLHLSLDKPTHFRPLPPLPTPRIPYRTLGEGMEPLLVAADLNPQKRPDQLNIDEWCRLARVFKSWSIKSNTPIPLKYYGYTEADEDEKE